MASLTMLQMFLLLLQTINTLELATTFVDDNGSGGNMFNVENIGAGVLTITRFDVHSSAIGSVSVTIYTKLGTYAGYTDNAAAWTQIYSDTVTGAGGGTATTLSPLPSFVTLNAGQTRAFYVIATSTRYTDGGTTFAEGSLYTSNADIAIYTGVGLSDWTLSPFAPRIWNGRIYYQLGTIPTESPTPSPTTIPTSHPTPAPTNIPTTNPTKQPSISPTKNPSKIPSIAPSKQPTQSPTKQPTFNPTQTSLNPTKNPTLSPSNSPTLPQGAINEDYVTTQLQVQHKNVDIAVKSSPNALESVFGSLWYLIFIAIAAVILFCIVICVVLWRKKKGNKKVASHMEKSNDSVVKHSKATKIGSESDIGFSTKDIELLPLPEEHRASMNVAADNANYDMLTPMGNVMTPFSGVNDNDVAKQINVTDAGMQKCQQCECVQMGKLDTDGTFYCNDCWAKWVETNEAGETHEHDDLYDIDKDNDMIQNQQTMGNSDEETPM